MNLDFLKRTSFWVSAATLIGAVAATASSLIPPTYGAVAIAVSACAYAISRGLAKYNNDLKRGWRTTEFWYGLFSIVVLAVGTVPFEWSAQLALGLTGAIGVLYQLSRGLADTPLLAGMGIGDDAQLEDSLDAGEEYDIDVDSEDDLRVPEAYPMPDDEPEPVV